MGRLGRAARGLTAVGRGRACGWATVGELSRRVAPRSGADPRSLRRRSRNGAQRSCRDGAPGSARPASRWPALPLADRVREGLGGESHSEAPPSCLASRQDRNPRSGWSRAGFPPEIGPFPWRGSPRKGGSGGETCGGGPFGAGLVGRADLDWSVGGLPPFLSASPPQAGGGRCNRGVEPTGEARSPEQVDGVDAVRRCQAAAFFAYVARPAVGRATCSGASPPPDQGSGGGDLRCCHARARVRVPTADGGHHNGPPEEERAKRAGIGRKEPPGRSPSGRRRDAPARRRRRQKRGGRPWRPPPGRDRGPAGRRRAVRPAGAPRRRGSGARGRSMVRGWAGGRSSSWDRRAAS